MFHGITDLKLMYSEYSPSINLLAAGRKRKHCMEPLHILYLAFYGFALFILIMFGIHKYVLLYARHKYRNDPIEPLNDLPVWPQVTVQLPIYNEKYVIKRLLRAVARLDYPVEKLHIQVLDDSSDDTVERTRRLVARLQQRGVNIKHIRRPERVGFKAGALEYGMNRTDSNYIAIFDADFVPDSDFLKRTIPHLETRPEIGMLQARWGHINRNYSLLTRLQAIFLDAHFLIEHYARNRSGKFFNFNGTAGIWRKQAIVDAGGWQHDTLTEDLDLSYRAQLKGWKFLYLPDVVVPAELPVEMNAYKSQQHRWAKGSVQTGLKLIPTIWKADLPWLVKMEAIIHLGSNFSYLLMTVPALLLIPVLNLQVQFDVRMAIIPYLLTFFAATFSVVVYYGYSIKKSTGRFFPYVMYIPALMGMGIGLSINNGKAVLEALFGQQSDFKRTPKFNIKKQGDTWKQKKYSVAKNKSHYVEILFAIYFTFGLAYFYLEELYLSIPFFLLFLFGFLFIAISSLVVRR